MQYIKIFHYTLINIKPNIPINSLKIIIHIYYESNNFNKKKLKLSKPPYTDLHTTKQ